MAGMPQSMTKSHPDLLITMMNVFNKFEIYPMPMAYVSSSIFANSGQIMILYLITIKLFLREVLVSPWSRYGGFLCDITQLHAVKCGLNKGCVIFLTSSNSFLKSLFLKFHCMILIS